VALAVFAVLLQIFAYYTLLARIEPFMYEFYIMAWWSYIIFVDAALAGKTGRHPVVNRHLPYVVVMSVGFWCLFELLNLRLENWFYVNIPYRSTIRFSGYVLAYGTVIPAILVTEELLSRVLPDVRTRPFSPGNYGVYAIGLGVLCLVASLAFPLYCYGLAWVFLVLVIDGYAYRKGYGSLMGDVARGSPGKAVRFALAGLICGLLWEFWNYWSITKWVYTVPFFENVKLFEMPVPGYLGFALFGIETAAFVNLLEKSPLLRRRRWATSVLVLAFSVLSFVLINRYTVFSYTAPVEGLSFLTEATRDALRQRGVKTSHAIDPRILDDREKEGLSLMHLSGLGYDNEERLRACGVKTIKGLAGLSQDCLSSMIGEGNMRRVRVYLRAAGAYEAAPAR
jgi:hypothetical protein